MTAPRALTRMTRRSTPIQAKLMQALLASLAAAAALHWRGRDVAVASFCLPTLQRCCEERAIHGHSPHQATLLRCRWLRRMCRRSRLQLSLIRRPCTPGYDMQALRLRWAPTPLPQPGQIVVIMMMLAMIQAIMAMITIMMTMTMTR